MVIDELIDDRTLERITDSAVKDVEIEALRRELLILQTKLDFYEESVELACKVSYKGDLLVSKNCDALDNYCCDEIVRVLLLPN